MNIKYILSAISIICGLTAWADRLELIEAEQVYQVYGRQVKSGDFAEYNAMLSYYKPEGSASMVLLIEQPGEQAEAITLSINPDGWVKKVEDNTEAYVYNAPDGSFDVVVMAVDGDDALLSLSRRKKPAMCYSFGRKPLHQ